MNKINYQQYAGGIAVSIGFCIIIHILFAMLLGADAIPLSFGILLVLVPLSGISFSSSFFYKSLNSESFSMKSGFTLINLLIFYIIPFILLGML